MKKIDIRTLNEIYEFDLVAKSSNSALLYTQGGTKILASVCMDKEAIEGYFVPLTVQYIEKAYACGKFPGGFTKREGKPSEEEILISRIIDRSLRPLFPKGFCYPTSIVVMVLSYDGETDLSLNALQAAQAALYTSDIPLTQGNVAAVRICVNQDSSFKINPSIKELARSEFNMFVSGKYHELLMIEMNTNYVEGKPIVITEDRLMAAITMAQDNIDKKCKIYERDFEILRKPVAELMLKVCSFNALAFLKNSLADKFKEALAKSSRTEKEDSFDEIIKIATEAGYSPEDITNSIGIYKRELVRNMILHDGIRADGRGLKDIRQIDIQTNILPHAHGSALFTRGQTQSLAVCTLGSDMDAQVSENLGLGSIKEKFLFHYNFPSFSVGRADPLKSPSRRELGHGNLARKALKASLGKHSQSIRLVSEILQSNGSSSMASVCSGSLALKAANVETKSLIAGVAMGLVIGEKNDDVSMGDLTSHYAILSDITGLEDHEGDMDFKVAGNDEGVSALQMDVKIGGLSLEILRATLMQAREARLHILGLMNEALKDLRVNYEILPKVLSFSVPVSKIGEIIGTGGKVIRGIIEQFDVEIDLERESGNVQLSGRMEENLVRAKDYILHLVCEKPAYEEGMSFKGKVKSIVDFGVFVSLPYGGDGLVHASKFNGNHREQLQGISEIECVISAVNNKKVELDLVKK